MSIEFYLHPNYQASIDDWSQYQDLFDGDPNILKSSKYLPYHQLEMRQQARRDASDSVKRAFESGNLQRRSLRSIRESNTHYTKLIGPILDIWKGLYFNRDLSFSEGVASLLDIMGDDVSGEGEDLQTFLRDSIFQNDYLYGTCFILVDAANVDPTSKAMEMASGARPFLTSLSPLDVKDWELIPDSGGKLSKLRYEYSSVPKRMSLSEKPEQVLHCRTLEMVDGGYESTTYIKAGAGSFRGASTWERESEPMLVQGFDELPVVYKSGESQVAEYAEEILRLYQHESSLDNGLGYQAWQRLYASGVNRTDEAEVAALTAFTVFLLGEGGTMGAIEPPEPAALERRVDRTLNLIFRKAMRQLRQLPADSRQAQAADSLREEKGDTFAIIKSKLKSYESLLTDAMEYAAMYLDASDSDISISIDKDVSNADVDRTLLLFQSLREELKSFPNTRKQLLSAIVKDAPIQDVDAALEEIKSTEIAQGRDGSSLLLSALSDGG